MKRVFRLPGSRGRIEHELDDELHFHLEGRVEELMEREHLSRDEAEREARRRFGDYDTYRREARDIDERTQRGRNRMELFDTFRREIPHAARVLIRNPAFSLIAFITLAVGIGATTAIYTVLDAVALRPLAYRDADRLVSVLHPVTVPGNGESTWGLSAGGYFFFRSRNHSFENLGVYNTGDVIVADGNSDPAPARAAWATATLFPTLRAHAALGHLIDSTDDVPGAPPVVVLSNEYWQRHFGGDRSIIGRMFQIGLTSYQIVGVAEPGLSLPKPGAFGSTNDLASFGVDLWFPEQLHPNGPFYNSHPYSGIARLKPGATVESAQRDLVTLMREFPQRMPLAYKDGFIKRFNFRVSVKPLRDEMLGPTLARTLWVLFAAVGVVLLIACANVANLFLVRIESRRRESAIRTALGADRAHMAVHYLSESLLLSLAAGVAGILIARVALGALLAIAPTSVPRLATVHVDPASVLIALALSLTAGLVFGLIPIGRTTLDVSTLRDGARGATASPTQRTIRDALVVTQTALALVLLAAAGLMLRSFTNLRHVKSGLDPNGVLTFTTVLPRSQYDSLSKVEAFQREFYDRVAAIPGVKTVGTVTDLPLQDYGVGCTSVVAEGKSYAEDDKPPCVPTPYVGPGFFESMSIRVRGHAPQWSDFAGIYDRPTVAVVTQALANRLWPGEDPIGKGIAIGNARAGYYRVVGVAPELRAHGLDQPPSEIVFASRVGSSMTFTVKTTSANPNELLPAIRRVLADMNPRVPILDVRDMQSVVDRSTSRTSFIMTLLAIAGSLALLLSAVGIYGVISYLVAQRRSEIGVRMALGARVPQVAALVLGQSMRLAGLGVAIGLLAALAGTRALRSLLFDVSPTDPVVLLGTAAVLVTIAAIATLAPTRRAAKIDPVEAMRA
ncbi:MAG TPA: ABC transporter permease [Gemmatimonadaceae bacterium]|nr:ABC transporter permease [Gemmatimonadaceae bacterium]